MGGVTLADECTLSAETMTWLRRLLRSRRLHYAVLVALVLVVLASNAWLSVTWFTSHDRIVVWDFHSPWLALRSLLKDGLNPYGDQVTLEIQRVTYGRPANQNEDQHVFAYPLSLLVLIGPLALLPLPVAQALWFLLLEASLLTFLFVAPRAVGWHPSLWLLALTALFTLGFYPDVWAMILGQVSIVVAVLVALAWWGLRGARWTMAGVCLALSTIKPQLVFLIVPAMLVWALCHRRRRLVTSFAVTLGIILLLPMLWMPGWPLEWAQQTGRYASYTIFEPPLALLTGSTYASWAVAGLLVAWIAAWWWRDRGQPDTTLGWGFSLLIVVTALVAPRTSQANQLILLLPLFLVFSRLRRQAVVAGVEVALLVGLWLIAALLLPPTSSPQHTVWQHRLISPILPIGLAAALVALTPRMRSEVAE
jgi:hypothetical protein